MVFHVFPSKTPAPQRQDKKVRGYYPRSVLTEAIKAVLQGRMTVVGSSEYYKIPRPTLQRKVTKARKEHDKVWKMQNEPAERGGKQEVPESQDEQMPSTSQNTGPVAPLNEVVHMEEAEFKAEIARVNKELSKSQKISENTKRILYSDAKGRITKQVICKTDASPIPQDEEESY